MIKRLFALLAALMLLTAAALADVPAKPKTFSYAVDYTSTLSEADKEEIAAYGEALLQATGGTKDGDEVVAVIVKFLDGMDSADYVTDLINTWGLGDNSVAILLATGDRSIDIGVGKGLDRLFSAKARGELIDNNLDYFAEDAFADGMVSLYIDVCERVAAVRGKTLTVATQQTGTSTATQAAAPVTSARNSSGGGIPLLPIILIIIVVIFLMTRMRGRRTPPRRQQPMRPVTPPTPPRTNTYANRNTPPAPQRPVQSTRPPEPPRAAQSTRPPAPQQPYANRNTPPAPQRPAQTTRPPEPQRSTTRSNAAAFGLGNLLGRMSSSARSASSRSSASRSSSSGSSRSSSSSSRSSGSNSRSGGSRGSSTGRKF